MCSLRSGCRQCPPAPRPSQCNRSIRKIEVILSGPDRKAGIREGGLTMWESPIQRSLGRSGGPCPRCASSPRKGPHGSSEAGSPIRPAAPTRYRKDTALLMSGTRIRTRTRWQLRVPLLTVVSYIARPDSFGSLRSTEAPSGLRVFRRETRVFRRLGAPPG
jgi:hypothetical protein